MPTRSKAKLPDGTWYFWDEPETPRWAKKDPELWNLQSKQTSEGRQKASREKAWLARTEEKKEEMEKLRAAFKVFDKDGSGKLDKNEVKEILTRSNNSATAMTDADANEFMALFDVNNDGSMDVRECELAALRAHTLHPHC